MKILIVGGTSGIGWALAQHYLRAGHQLAVCGRDVQRIDQAQARQYAQLTMYQLDIADTAALSAAVNEFGASGLDMLIVSAGFYFNTRHHELDATTTLRMLRTNVSGLNAAFELAAEKMIAQGYGHLVGISSVAGLLKDYPGASVYSACKRTVLSLCDTYRIALSPFAVKVTAIVPGYVDTAKLRELNDGDASHKPFIMSEEKAVALIATAIQQAVPVSVFPWQMRWMIRLLNFLPAQLLKLRR